MGTLTSRLDWRAFAAPPRHTLDPDWGRLDGLAFDRAPAETTRRIDLDGRCHVAHARISKAAVNEYRGSECPQWQELGLDRDRLYKLFRPPEELAAAATTYNAIPILRKHVAVSAADHRPDIVIGATGSDAEFVFPYLTVSVVIWVAADIAKIQSGTKCQLSAAYTYSLDLTPGMFQGERYDGRMKNLRGSHVAVVTEGRVGEDVTL